jgi:hypothetical protein
MIPKSDDRFSEKIMLKQKGSTGMTTRREVIALQAAGRGASACRAKRLAVRSACVHLKGAAKGPMRVAT